MHEEVILTGKIIIEKHDTGEKSFLLEAILADHTTMLRAIGDVPEGCLYDKNGHHSGLRIKSTLSSLPNKYLVSCKCGYEKIVEDINGKAYRHQ